ncbi:SPOR domain-containing protein [Acanthopleuribacter pedis]|uniref:Uncharacterized protein n=1 Tax=Acanthopleuribacter pedis TaxID=442870 RepID=A0A8J7QAV7_9BACT|nr:hypothetical protein [Acanthopleuribacter pedis]MBO1320254.1 hypothetical protein [Acanthopleuribacter pedis]
MFLSGALLSRAAVFFGAFDPHRWLMGLAQLDGADGGLFPWLVLVLLLLNLVALIAIWWRLGNVPRAEPVQPTPAAPPAPALVDDTVAQTRFEAHDKQMKQVIELLDMINDNGNINTDYVLEALQGGAVKTGASGTRPAPATPKPAAPKPVVENTVAAPDPSPTAAVTASEPTPEPAKPAAEAIPDAPLDRAFYLLEHRDEDYQGRLQEAVTLFKGELNSVHVGRAQAALSEAYFWLGDVSRSKSDEKKWHGQGTEHGEKAIKLEPDAIEANFWYAANIGAWGVANGIMSSLGSIGPLQKHGNLSLDMDRTYFHAAPLRLMGRFYHQVPGFMVSGNPKKLADSLLREAVEVGPDFYLNHLFLAEYLIDNRGKKEARQLLEGILDRPPTIYPNYQKNVLDDCRKLMRRL